MSWAVERFEPSERWTNWTAAWSAFFSAVLVAAAVLACTPARADGLTVGMHLASKHSRSGLNNVNPGLYLRTDDGWTAGAYCNSESRSDRFKDAPTCKVSTYAGRTWSTDVGPVEAAVTLGAITGYSRAPVQALLVPSVAWRGVRLTYAPPAAPKGSHVLHLSIEGTF